MNIRRIIAIVFLSGGVIGGYASGIHSLRSGSCSSGGCHSRHGAHAAAATATAYGEQRGGCDHSRWQEWQKGDADAAADVK